MKGVGEDEGYHRCLHRPACQVHAVVQQVWSVEGLLVGGQGTEGLVLTGADHHRVGILAEDDLEAHPIGLRTHVDPTRLGDGLQDLCLIELLRAARLGEFVCSHGVSLQNVDQGQQWGWIARTVIATQRKAV